MMKLRRLLILLPAVFLPAAAFAATLDTGKIDERLGRSGEKAGEVYRVGFPRTDLHVQVRGIDIKPGLALGSWAAFSGTEEAASVMGDLVLLPEEVPAVMKKLRSAGFEITALHNHLLGENPRIAYMHYMGHGSAATLAGALRAALDATGTPPPAPPAAKTDAPAAPEWAAALQEAMGRKGNFKGGVLSFSVPRKDPIRMGGMTLTPAQGVAEAINFQEAGGGKVATTGDFVLVAEEVNPVISALQEHAIEVTALHSHMLDEQPRLFFMHFWAVADPGPLGQGIRSALGRVAVQ
jgi:uncharacterized protein DUF1259